MHRETIFQEDDSMKTFLCKENVVCYHFMSLPPINFTDFFPLGRMKVIPVVKDER